MTGFGKSEMQNDELILSLELRTLNSRFLDFVPRLPRVLIPFEDEDKAQIRILKKTTELDQFWDPAVQMALYVFGYIGNSRRHKIHQSLDKAGWIGVDWSQSNRMPFMGINAEMEYSYLEKFYFELISEFKNLTNNSISRVCHSPYGVIAKPVSEPQINVPPDW